MSDLKHLGLNFDFVPQKDPFLKDLNELVAKLKLLVKFELLFYEESWEEELVDFVEKLFRHQGLKDIHLTYIANNLRWVKKMLKSVLDNCPPKI